MDPPSGKPEETRFGLPPLSPIRAAREYGPFSDASLLRQRGLAGVSLYTPRLNEIQYPQVRWLPDRATSSPVFLLQVPCSWGALFLGSAFGFSFALGFSDSRLLFSFFTCPLLFMNPLSFKLAL